MRRSVDEIKTRIEARLEETKRQKRRRRLVLFTALPVLVAAAVTAGFIARPYAGGGANLDGYLPLAKLSPNVMSGIVAEDTQGKTPDDAFVNAYNGFGIKLFQSTVSEGGNALTSPLSAMYVLAMTANGAVGETRAQMQSALGGIDVNTLNAYLYDLGTRINNEGFGTLKTANSIWFRDGNGFYVNEGFLKTNAGFYGADIRKSPFDMSAVEEINGWVKDKTDGMIDRVVEEIDDEALMMLINAVCFDAEWADKTSTEKDAYFTRADGGRVLQTYLHFSYTRNNCYIETENATGVVKHYLGGAYSFAALMPNEGIDIYDYIASMTGGEFTDAVKNGKEVTMNIVMPKFKYDCSTDLIPAMESMGMTDIFSRSRANLNGLMRVDGGNAYVSVLEQKTFIEVTGDGTRAAAVTGEFVGGMSAPPNVKDLTLDRPFVYAITDNETGIPVFIGAYVG